MGVTEGGLSIDVDVILGKCTIPFVVVLLVAAARLLRLKRRKAQAPPKKRLPKK